MRTTVHDFLVGRCRLMKRGPDLEPNTRRSGHALLHLP